MAKDFTRLLVKKKSGFWYIGDMLVPDLLGCQSYAIQHRGYPGLEESKSNELLYCGMEVHVIVQEGDRYMSLCAICEERVRNNYPNPEALTFHLVTQTARRMWCVLFDNLLQRGLFLTTLNLAEPPKDMPLLKEFVEVVIAAVDEWYLVKCSDGTFDLTTKGLGALLTGMTGAAG